MARIRMKGRGQINVRRVVSKVAVTIVVLYAGGTVLTELGSVMNCTASPFYQGLTLIGWTITTSNVPQTTGVCNSTAYSGVSNLLSTYSNQVTNTSGAGILTVVGIIAIASIVLEFVQIRL